jgi:adenylyltransferase/sulfurtransferase
MSATDLHRDARHRALAQVGTRGQERIARSTALVMGVGGLGCAAATYLASAGVGQLLLCDFDTVDATNLGRQVLFRPGDIDSPKAIVAAERLRAQNPDVRITAIAERLSDAALAEAVSQADVVLDGTDNFATRFQVNGACVDAQRCLVSGSAIRLEGQFAVFGPDYAETPCYRCLYSEADESFLDCAGNGVLAPVPGVIGTMMATHALMYLAGNESPKGVLTLFDAASGAFQTVTISKRDDCVACSRE